MVTENVDTKLSIKIHEQDPDGSKDWKSLKQYYEGMGVYAIDIIKAKIEIQNIYYAGEKPPTMYWKLSESRLNTAFVIIKKYDVHGHEDQSRKVETTRWKDLRRLAW